MVPIDQRARTFFAIAPNAVNPRLMLQLRLLPVLALSHRSIEMTLLAFDLGHRVA